ncbi:MAG TPA: hypothetical protein VH277_11215 [Gemmatimonadaceae bacterium]|nr:hypothetical protein [Gemmatimonadaceae bacterium]
MHTPFQMHHGELDTTVPLSYDQRFDSPLTSTAVEHQLFVYAGETHLDVRTDPVVLAHVHDWYAAHGMFAPWSARDRAEVRTSSPGFLEARIR